MKVQYALYKIELDTDGKEVEIYLCQGGKASTDHEQAWLLTSDQVIDDNSPEIFGEEFPYVRIDPAVSTEAYFSEYYNLFVEDKGLTILGLVKRDLISLKIAVTMILSQEIAQIFFTLLKDLLKDRLITNKHNTPYWVKGGGSIESIPLEAFKEELHSTFTVALNAAPKIYADLKALEKFKAK